MRLGREGEILMIQTFWSLVDFHIHVHAEVRYQPQQRYLSAASQAFSGHKGNTGVRNLALGMPWHRWGREYEEKSQTFNPRIHASADSSMPPFLYSHKHPYPTFPNLRPHWEATRTILACVLSPPLLIAGSALKAFLPLLLF